MSKKFVKKWITEEAAKRLERKKEETGLTFSDIILKEVEAPKDEWRRKLVKHIKNLERDFREYTDIFEYMLPIIIKSKDLPKELRQKYIEKVKSALNELHDPDSVLKEEGRKENEKDTSQKTMGHSMGHAPNNGAYKKSKEDCDGEGCGCSHDDNMESYAYIKQYDPYPKNETKNSNTRDNDNPDEEGEHDKEEEQKIISEAIHKILETDLDFLERYTTDTLIEAVVIVQTSLGEEGIEVADNAIADVLEGMLPDGNDDGGVME